MARKFLNGIDAASQRIINLASPTSATDAVNKTYVDNLTAGLSWKDEVRAATTTNGTLATAYANGQVIDGITLATNDRILIKNQTTQTENGIYTVNASGAPTRATDADSTAELNNATVFVNDGTTQAGTAWTQTTKNPTIGSSNIVFAQFGAGQAYTAGNGLQLSANQFSVLLNGGANSGLTVGGSGVAVNPGNGIDTSGGSTALKLDNTGGAGQSGLTVGTNGLKVNPGTGLTVAGGNLAVDTSVITRKFAASIGDGSTTAIAVTHSLGTRDIQAQVYDNTTFETVECDVVRTSTTVATFTFAVAPTSNQYRVVIQG